MQIAAYRGVAEVSRLIQWETRSPYSHIAVWFPAAQAEPELNAEAAEGAQRVAELYEAIDAGWVRAGTLGENHDRGTEVDLFDFTAPLTAVEEAAALTVARRMVGARYDYKMVCAGFPLRFNQEPHGSRNKLFCSEGAFIVAAAGGRELLERIQPWQVSPRDVVISPLLKWVRTVTL
jgi:hypothetical protein